MPKHKTSTKSSSQPQQLSVRDFWLSLSPDRQRALCEVDKTFVLKSLRSHHRHTCSCPTCGKRRTIFDREVQLFENYCSELEKKKAALPSPFPSPHFAGAPPSSEYVLSPSLSSS
jgi:hypothetical protein